MCPAVSVRLFVGLKARISHASHEITLSQRSAGNGNGVRQEREIEGCKLVGIADYIVGEDRERAL